MLSRVAGLCALCMCVPVYINTCVCVYTYLNMNMCMKILQFNGRPPETVMCVYKCIYMYEGIYLDTYIHEYIKGLY